MRATVTAADVASGSTLFAFTGSTRSSKFKYSLQVGEALHMTALETDPEPPWIFMDHSFAPTVRLEQHQKDNSIVLQAIALDDLPHHTLITFDYTLWEWEMDERFRCMHTDRWVAGWLHLTEAEKEAALPYASTHIQALHNRWLFGQSSRC